MNHKFYIGLVGICATTACAFFYFTRHFNSPKTDDAQNVYEVLSHYQVPYDIDKRGMGIPTDTTPQPVHGAQEAINNLAYFTKQHLPISMILVGFPFKSSNQEKKVVGYLPDMAERRSLQYLQMIVDEIKQVYKPGAKVFIFTDGVPFAEFFGIPLDNVIAYEQTLRQLAQDLPDITIFSSKDMMQKHGLSSIADITALIDQYEPSNEKVKEEMQAIPETPLKRFALELDHAEGKKLVQQYGLDTIVFNLLAREMRLRNYLKDAFPAPHYFRLTVHFCPDITKKFGIRLSPDSDITPYHGVMVEENNDAWSIRFRKDIDQQKYTLENQVVNDVSCPYFRAL